MWYSNSLCQVSLLCMMDCVQAAFGMIGTTMACKPSMHDNTTSFLQHTIDYLLQRA